MKTLTELSAWLRRRSIWPLLGLALFQFALHIWVSAYDNFFRDELYYLAAGQHLDLGYVDFPPFVAFVAALSRALLGQNLVVIRLLPALAGALLILLTARIAAELGGGRWAQFLAALAVALGPVFLGISGLLTMDPFDQLWWTLAVLIVVRLIHREETRRWLLFGVVAGIGLLTKVTFVYWAAALLFGFLLTPQRKLLLNRWLVLGGVIALILFSPYLFWQVQHGFPTLDFWKVYASGKTYPVTPLEFFAQQVITLNPLALPLWLAGLYYFFFTAKNYRVFGWAFLFLYVVFTLQQAKFYFLAPAYPVLFAGGACLLEGLAARRSRLAWIKGAYPAAVAVVGLAVAPLSVPLLPPQTFIRYNAVLGGVGDVRQERLAQAELPQTYADRYGWPEMVASVAEAYYSLPSDERAVACILTQNYGEAGAIDFYGPALGLPRAISGHNSYFIWGPQGCTGQVIISVNLRASDLTPFESAQQVGQVKCQYCQPLENSAPIYIARRLQVNIDQVWPTARLFY